MDWAGRAYRRLAGKSVSGIQSTDRVNGETQVAKSVDPALKKSFWR